VSTKTYALALLAVAAMLAIAGCGSDSDSTSDGGAYGGKGGAATESSESPESSGGAYAPPSSGGAATQSPADGEAANVSLASVGDLGLVLVDGQGFTLYDFHKDKGGKSSCAGACAEAWPPLLTNGEPTAGNGADASMLGTTERTDGTTQVTYNGWPLYTFAGDKKPGEGNGNDVTAFGEEWYALKGNGQEAEG
jgi:predicted lipoprotein with Yx(FWY)xxD motif